MKKIHSGRRKSWGRDRTETDNKFLAQIEKLIDQSTNPAKPTPAWDVALSLCDLINQHPTLSELTIKAIHRRLVADPPQHQQRLYCLIITDMLVKNCGSEVHRSVSNEAFVGTMLELAGKKVKSRYLKKKAMDRITQNYEKELVQEKVLELIQSWGPLHKREMPIFDHTFQHLVHKGVDFPAVSAEDKLPWAVKDKEGRSRQESFQFLRSRAKEAAKSPSIEPALAAELDGIKQTAILLDDIVRALEPGQDAAENEIAVDCYDKLKESATRVRELLGEREEDDITELLLLVNERILVSMDAYKRHSGVVRIGANGSLDDSSSDSEGYAAEWKEAIKTVPARSDSMYAAAGFLDIPSHPDGPIGQDAGSIALGLDYLESISVASAPGLKDGPADKTDAEFENWLLGKH